METRRETRDVQGVREFAKTKAQTTESKSTFGVHLRGNSKTTRRPHAHFSHHTYYPKSQRDYILFSVTREHLVEIGFRLEFQRTENVNNRPLCVFFVANAHTLPGLTTRTAREYEAAAIKGNQGTNHGINQSTGRRGRIKISGCSRKPASGGSPLSSEEPIGGPERIRNVSSAIPFLAMIGDKSSHGRRSHDSSIHQAVYYVSRIYGICWIYRNYRASFVDVIAFIYISHKKGKTGFHVSTRRA